MRASRSPQSDLPPLRVHHLFYFLGVAAVASAMHHGAQLQPAPESLVLELQEMASWLGAALGASMWALGLWWCMRGRGFLVQPGPWLLAASLIEIEFPARLATVCERLLIGADGAVAAFLREHWYAEGWSRIPAFVVGALMLGAAGLPERRSAFGPIWRVLLAFVGVQTVVGVFVGPWTTELGRWQGWRLVTWETRTRGAVALAAAAILRDATWGRRRHWSHALCIALWIAMQLGRHAALNN
jgi:hypothetical protein